MSAFTNIAAAPSDATDQTTRRLSTRTMAAALPTRSSARLAERRLSEATTAAAVAAPTTAAETSIPSTTIPRSVRNGSSVSAAALMSSQRRGIPQSLISRTDAAASTTPSQRIRVSQVSRDDTAEPRTVVNLSTRAITASRVEPGAEFVFPTGRVQVLNQIGRGSWGTVWRVVRYNADGTVRDTLALKTSRCDGFNDPACEEAKAVLDKELEYLRACIGYPRIVQIVDYLSCFENRDPECRALILLELADGTLMDFIQESLDADVYPDSPLISVASFRAQNENRQKFSSNMRDTLRNSFTRTTFGFAASNYGLIRHVTEGCAKALQQFRIAMKNFFKLPVHVIHGDIRFSNFLVKKGVIQLADFGSANLYPRNNPDLGESILSYGNGYQDPGTDTRYGGTLNSTFLTDEYALGVMLWSMAFDSFLANNDVVATTVYARALQLQNKTNAPFVLEAILGLTHPDLHLRWTIENLLTSQFLASVQPGPDRFYVDPQLILLTQPREVDEAWSLGFYDNTVSYTDAPWAMIDIRNNMSKFLVAGEIDVKQQRMMDEEPELELERFAEELEKAIEADAELDAVFLEDGVLQRLSHANGIGENNIVAPRESRRMGDTILARASNVVSSERSQPSRLTMGLRTTGSATQQVANESGVAASKVCIVVPASSSVRPAHPSTSTSIVVPASSSARSVPPSTATSVVVQPSTARAAQPSTRTSVVVPPGSVVSRLTSANPTTSQNATNGMSAAADATLRRPTSNVVVEPAQPSVVLAFSPSGVVTTANTNVATAP